jgi:hypothetical protein
MQLAFSEGIRIGLIWDGVMDLFGLVSKGEMEI